MKKKNQTFIVKTSVSGLCLALCWLLPLLTGQIPKIGNMLCPMHLPVFLCGFLCGPWYGVVLGLIAPLTRSLIFSMPPLFPKALCMAFELAGYGLISGALYRLFPKKNGYIYLSLAISMLGGRLLWGAANYLLYFAGKTDFSLAIFWSSGFLNAIPGIILQFILVPGLVIALKRNHKMKELLI